jgi:thioredoxin 1
MLKKLISFLSVVAVMSAATFAAHAADKVNYDAKAFAAARAAGKPILVEIHATWCPTCKVQAPILGDLEKQDKFKNLMVFHADFDSQKDAVKAFGARMQSTLITFKGSQETGRSVGDTNSASIASLLDKTTWRHADDDRQLVARISGRRAFDSVAVRATLAADCSARPYRSINGGRSRLRAGFRCPFSP